MSRFGAISRGEVAERPELFHQGRVECGNDGGAQRPRFSQEQRLTQLENEIDNLIELAATQGTSQKVSLAITDREREAAEIKSRLARRKAPLGSEALADRIRRSLSDLGNMFRSSPEDARKALGALLGDNRLRVKKDSENGFSVFGEGVLCFGGAGDPTRPEHSGNLGAATVCVPIRLEF